MKLVVDEEIKILSNALRRKIMLSLCYSPLSFSALKNNFQVNPNSLSRQLDRLTRMKLITNFYQKSDGKDYSYYNITDKGLALLGHHIIFPFQIKLLERFKRIKRPDWKWQGSADFVKVDNQYHSFLVFSTPDRELSNHVFLMISKKKQTAYVDRTGEHFVSLSYIAWFLGTYSARLSDLLRNQENELSHNTALYCLAPHRSICFVYNNTNSVVFKEFERFLGDVGLRLEPFPKETREV